MNLYHTMSSHNNLFKQGQINWIDKLIHTYDCHESVIMIIINDLFKQGQIKRIEYVLQHYNDQIKD